MRRNKFNSLLLETESEQDRIKFIRKYVLHGDTYVIGSDQNLYFEFKNRISDQFSGVDFSNIFIVGSAKTGFSYIKGTKFTYNSDIDVAIVNEKLFDYFFSKITDYQYDLESLGNGLTQREHRRYFKFLTYLIKGWMRPDLLPPSAHTSSLQTEWFDFFQSISSAQSDIGNYKVNAGLYKNINCLEKYILTGIESYYNNLNMEL